METRGLLDRLFAAQAMGELFSDRARVQGMLDFEAALARAEAASNVIREDAAIAIAAECRAERFDLDALSSSAALAGNLAIPLVKALTDRVAEKDPEAARFVHWGATSQDAIDTGLVLQLRSAFELFDVDLVRLTAALAELTRAHRSTVLLGRTWLQSAPPITFGLKVAGWLSAIQRQRARLRELRARLLVVQLGGAVGTLASLQARGLAVATRLAEELKLSLPDIPWHTQRDRVAETATVLGLLAGTLGKIGRDISLLMQTDVAEVFEPRGPGRGGSSTMPHKHNPVGAAVMLAAATRVPFLVGTLLAAMPQEQERGLGGWQAEWDVLPEICLLTSGALQQAVHVVEGLEVDDARMRANFEATLGVVLAEPVALALARRMDRRVAHELVARMCARAQTEGRPLSEVLLADEHVSLHLSAAEIRRLCDPTAYLGLAESWIDRVLASVAGESRETWV